MTFLTKPRSHTVVALQILSSLWSTCLFIFYPVIKTLLSEILMRKRGNENLCPRYPGRQWKQMLTFKGNKFDMGTDLVRIIAPGVCVYSKSKLAPENIASSRAD